MYIKRILSLLLMLVIAICLVACNEYEITSNTASVNNEALTENDSEETSDENITESAENKEEIESSQKDSSSKASKPDSSSKSNKSEVSVTTTTSTTKPADVNTSSSNYKQATDKDKNVTVASDGTVSITIPKWFLLKMEPDYDYKLTDKEANSYKFKSVEKNADGSATYKIGYNDYHGFLLISQSSVNAVVYKYKHNIWFSKIDADAGYNNIKIYTKYNSLEDFDDDFGAYIALSGLQTTFYQYMHLNYSVGTTITVYNKDNAVLETYKFPDLLK